MSEREYHGVDASAGPVFWIPGAGDAAQRLGTLKPRVKAPQWAEGICRGNSWAEATQPAVLRSCCTG